MGSYSRLGVIIDSPDCGTSYTLGLFSNWEANKARVEVGLTNSNCNQSLENENPGPPRLPTNTIHLSDTSSQETTKGTSKGSSGEEDCHAETAFVTSIPHGNVKSNAGEQTTLRETERHTTDQETDIVGNQTHEGHGDTPSKHDNCEPERGAGLLHHEVAGNLSRHIPGKEYCQSNLSQLNWLAIQFREG